MPIHKAECIILNKYNFRETSLIINFYSREFGKISGLLKGARADSQKFASPLETFSHNDIVFYKKTSGSLHLVSQCDLKDNFNGIRTHIPKVGQASIMMELLDSIMPQEDKNEEIFELALSCLKEIALNNNSEKITTIFKIKLLSLSGFKPHLDSCVICQSKIMDVSRFSLSLGGLVCNRCTVKDPSSRSIFRGTIASILHIERNDLKNNLNLGLNPQIKKELDLILNSFLNFHLGKDLKSQKIVNRISEQSVALSNI